MYNLSFIFMYCLKFQAKNDGGGGSTSCLMNYLLNYIHLSILHLLCLSGIQKHVIHEIYLYTFFLMLVYLSICDFLLYVLFTKTIKTKLISVKIKCYKIATCNYCWNDVHQIFQNNIKKLVNEFMHVTISSKQ